MGFNVLNYRNGDVCTYNILPYFHDCWNDKYNKEEKEKIKAAKYKAKRMQLFKEWVIGRSKYMFWARCEYEHLVGPWPFGSWRMNERVQPLLDKGVDLKNYEQNIDFCNAVTTDMKKIDIHFQIMMNIDVIVDILYKEFKLDKTNKKK